MRSTSFLRLSACVWLALLTPALAQDVDSGLEVQVNPGAARSGGATLLYPGGEFMRSVPPLLYPGEKGGPIRLHMPSRHRVVRAASALKSTVEATAEPRAEPKPKAKPKPRVARAEPAPPQQQAQPAQPAQPAQEPSNPYFGTPDLSNVFGQQPQAPRPQPKVASVAPRPAPKPAAPAPAAPATDAGLTKRSVILFAKDAADPAEGALGAIKFLASDLNAAMTRAASRVELQAYGGAKGDKGSDARRLSLKRALAIRQVLIQDGVSADRIDVRAMGGADDSGPADRVDVYVRA